MNILITEAISGIQNIDNLLSGSYEKTGFEEENGFLFSVALPSYESSPRSKKIICFIKGISTKAHYILAGTRGYPAESNATQLNVTEVKKLENPITLTSVTNKLAPQYKHHAEKAIKNRAVLPNKSGEQFIKLLCQSNTEIEDFIQSLSTSKSNRPQSSTFHTNALADHHDAVLTAFDIAGFDRGEMSVTRVSEDGEWFLDRIEDPRLREDPTVIWDSERVPDLDLVNENIHGKRFSGNGKTLTVMLINRLPLEEVTGTDLIYINETTGSFVGVQYKMWESEKRKEIFRTSSGNFLPELKRMEEISQALEKIDAGSPTPQNYRLSNECLYFKICSRSGSTPDQIRLFSVDHISLGYFNHLRQTEVLKGAQGGERFIRWDKNLHPLQTGEFINLVKSGLIGSYPPQTVLIKKLIQETLKQGRAVTLATLSEAPDQS